MLLTEDQVQTLIYELQGTCKTMDEAMPEGFTEDDLTEDQLNEIDQEIFRCADCSWWFEASDEADTGKDGERVCLNCFDIEEHGEE